MSTGANVVVGDMVAHISLDGYPEYLGKAIEKSQPVDEWFFVRLSTWFNRIFPDERGLVLDYIYELKGDRFVIYKLYNGKTKIGRIPVKVAWKNLEPKLIIKDSEGLAITVYSDDIPDLGSVKSVAEAFMILARQNIPVTPRARGDVPCKLL